MSDQHPNGDDIARMLREQGPVQAPPDLADEVMRQVRAEPRRQPRPTRRFRLPHLGTVLKPAIGLAVVAVFVVVVANLPHAGSSSSAGGTSGAAAAGTSAPAPLRHAAATKRTFAIPARSAKTLSIYGRSFAQSTAKSDRNTEPNAQVKTMPYTLTLRGAQYTRALAQLRALSAAHMRHQHEPAVVVTLRREP